MMDAQTIIAGLSCALGVLVPAAVFATHLERRLTRLETLVETALERLANNNVVQMRRGRT